MTSALDVSLRSARWSRSRWLLLAELSVVLALTLGHRHVPFSATPFFLALGWTSLRLRGLRWRDVGLVRTRPWPATLALGTVAGIAMELFSIYVSEPVLAGLLGRPPDLSSFRPLVGSLGLLAIAVVASWTVAAFGEETAFRGYLMSRLAGVAGGTRGAWLVSVIVTTVIFGTCHYEVQGITGALQAGIDGLLLALLYLACRRTLPVPIVAHGMSNTLAFVLIYFDRYPGV